MGKSANRWVGLTLWIMTLCAVIVADMGAVNRYKDGDQVVLFVNKVGPYFNPQETYHYYQLPVCRPKTIQHRSLSLGKIFVDLVLFFLDEMLH